MLVERAFGGLHSKVLTFVFYFITLLLLSLPGIVLAIVCNLLGWSFFSANTIALLAMALLNVPIGLLLLYLCRNMLQYAELNQQ